jgi:hypothetical protein
VTAFSARALQVRHEHQTRAGSRDGDPRLGRLDARPHGLVRVDHRLGTGPLDLLDAGDVLAAGRQDEGQPTREHPRHDARHHQEPASDPRDGDRDPAGDPTALSHLNGDRALLPPWSRALGRLGIRVPRARSRAVLDRGPRVALATVYPNLEPAH